MAQRPVLGVEITGWGTALPEQSLTNDELIAAYALDSSHDWITKRTGIERRHIATNGENVVSLGTEAGRLALQAAGISAPADVDSLFLGSSTSSTYRPVPGSHSGIQRRLGEQGFNIHHSEETNTACTSFMTAMINSYLNFEVFGIDRALVVGSDTLSAITDYSDRNTGILFGDGAGAVVMQRNDDSDSGLLGVSRSTDGNLEDILYCEPGGCLQMDGREVFKHAVSMVANHSIAALEAAKTNPDEIALMIPHQANVRIMEAVGRRLNMPMDRVAVTIDRHGNTSSASIPLAMADVLNDSHDERIQKGSKLLLVGFGAGMTAAAAVIRW